MFEHFARDAREAVRVGAYEARSERDRVRPEHLLVGILHGQSGSARLLRGAGLSLDDVRRHLADRDARYLSYIGVSSEDVIRTVGALVGSDDPLPPKRESRKPEFTRQARRLLAGAEREAKRLRSRKIRTEHLVVALCRDSNTASEFLAESGIDPNALAVRLESEVA